MSDDTDIVSELRAYEQAHRLQAGPSAGVSRPDHEAMAGRYKRAADEIETLRGEQAEMARIHLEQATMIREAEARVEALVKERDELKLAVNIQDRMAENYATVELQRLELAAVIEKVGRIVDYHPDSTVSFQVSNALAAPADALREHDAALIESLADEWSEWETFTASDGYRSIRQHGLSPNDWLRARAQQIREERADG